MENQIVLAMDDEHIKFVEPDLEALNGEDPEEEEEEEEQVDEYDRRQYSSHQQGVQSLDKVDNAGYKVEQSVHHGRDSSEGKLFVGGISWETTEETFSNYFRKYGEIADSVIMMDKTTGRPRGFGFVTFSDPADADKVLEKEHVIDGRTVEVKRTVPREDMQQQQVNKGVTKTKKIFVGGIPPSFTEDEMKEYFSSYGSIVEHQIMLDHSTGRSRGFGFVTFETEDAVERVFVDGQRHELGGKQVEIKRAEPKRSEGGSGGSAQRSSYGGGGGFRSSGAGYGGRNSSRGEYGGAKGRGYGGSGYDNYESYDTYSGNYGGGAAGFYGGSFGAGGYGYGFGGSMYGAPSGYPGYGVIPGYGAGRGYGAGGGAGGYGAGRGYGSSDGGYGGRGYSGGMEGGYGGGRGYGGGIEAGYGSGGGYGSSEGEYGNSRGGYDSGSASVGGSRGRGSGYGSAGAGRGYGSAGNSSTGSARYHPYQRS